MNTLPLPPHLRAIRELLEASLIGNATDIASPAPPALFADLGQHFAPPISKASAMISHGSFFEKLRSLVASPAFGLAALVILAVVGIQAMPKASNGSDSFRGTAVAAAPAATIILLTSDPSYREILEKSGLFDMASVIETSDPTVADKVAKPKLLLDFNNLKMMTYDSQSREIGTCDVPGARGKLVDFILSSASALK